LPSDPKWLTNASVSGGGVATLTANAATYPVAAPVWETEVHGTRSMVRVRTRGFAETGSADGTGQRYEVGLDEETVRPHYNFERQAADLLDAITTGWEPLATGLDGLRAVEICLAAYASADLARPVAIDEIRQWGGRAPTS